MAPDIMERNPGLIVVLHVSVQEEAGVTDKPGHEAEYYHARVADMMAKAQDAPSKATRAAYLNLARIWARKAANLEKEWLRSQLPDSADQGEGPAPGQKNSSPPLGRGNF
jgi:hypothetical protein